MPNRKRKNNKRMRIQYDPPPAFHTGIHFDLRFEFDAPDDKKERTFTVDLILQQLKSRLNIVPHTFVPKRITVWNTSGGDVGIRVYKLSVNSFTNMQVAGEMLDQPGKNHWAVVGMPIKNAIHLGEPTKDWWIYTICTNDKNTQLFHRLEGTWYMEPTPLSKMMESVPKFNQPKEPNPLHPYEAMLEKRYELKQRKS